VVASKAALSGERKRVTVMFADLRGSLNVMADADPEEGQALLDAVVATMIEAVHRYEGAVGQVMGDGIMALFGAPIAHEDHALRAACAALGMQEAVRELHDPTWEAHKVSPQIRVGLNSGEVAIRTIRSDLIMDYRAVGATTHIASRMEQLAPPGAIYLTQTTFDLGQGLLRTKPLGPMQVKGVPAAIQVHELTGISVRTRFQANALRGLSPLAGRAELLAQLEAALARAHAADGVSQVVVLHGEPGVGKSRLCYELLQRASSARVLEAASLSYLSARPHGLLASMVRALFEIADDDDPSQVRAKAEQCLGEYSADVREQLFVALELLDIPSQDARWQRLDPLQKRRSIEDFLRLLLTQFCAQGSTIVLCEDLHWCDSESLSFVASLVDEPPGPHTLLLLTHRPGPVPPWRIQPHVWTSEVASLTATDAESLLTGILGDNESFAPLRSWLAMRTDGNPFFIEESVRTLRENGLVDSLPRRSDRMSAEVPATIDALLGGRVDRLPEAVQEVLQAAAVIGDQGSVETLRAVTQLSPAEFAERFEVLTRAEMLYEAVHPIERDASTHATIRFKHALIQEVVYKRLLRPHKRALHARVVEVMETQHKSRLAEHLEALAEHAFRAELWTKSIEYQMSACIRAASRGANTLALEHLERGLEAVKQLPEGPERARADVDLRLIALAPLLPMGAHERVIELLREAEASAMQLNDLGRLARVSCQLAPELWCTAQYDLARASAEQAIRLAKQLGGEQFGLLESSARHGLAMVQHAVGEYEAARQGLTEVLQAIKAQGVQRRMGWAGYPNVMVNTFVISIASMTGAFADATHAFNEGHALAQQLNHGFSSAMILEQYGMCLMVQGEHTRAVESLRRAEEICQREEIQTMTMPICSHLALALLELGRVDEAALYIDRASAAPRSEAGHYAVTYLQIALSELRRKRGQAEEARAIAEESVRDTAACGERGFYVRALLQLACILADLPAERKLALARYAEAEHHAQQLGMPPWAALALQGAGAVHAALQQPQQANACFEAARAIWHRLEVPARLAELSDAQAR
jgi:predicted ATPase/class 3 adenylate cyclase